MDLHAIIGQRLVFGFQGPALTESFRQLVRQYKIGNVILFRHNVVDNARTPSSRRAIWLTPQRAIR